MNGERWQMGRTLPQVAPHDHPILDAIVRAGAIAGIQKGLDSANRGEGEAAGDVFARLRKKHKIAAE